MSWQAESPLTHENAHARPDTLDPRKNGPFLDDIRADQERAYRNARMKQGHINANKAGDDTQEIDPVAEEDADE